MEKNNQRLWTKDFISITLITLLIFSGFQMLLPTLPVYVKTLGTDPSVIGWIIGIVTIASVIMRPISGALLDKFGRRWVFIVGIIVNILMTLAYNWFPIAGAILAIRFVNGLGWGAAATASSTIASDIIPKERFGEGVGYFSLSNSLAMALAPGIGLSILAAFGFSNLCFFAAGLWVIGLVLSFFIRYRKIENKKGEKRKIILYEKSALRPAAVMIFVGTTYGLITSFISIYAAERGIDNISMFFMLFAGSLFLSRPLLGKLVDRYGFDVVVYPGFLFLAAALIVLSMSNTLWLFLFGGLLYGLGFSAVQSSLQTMSVVSAPKDKLGAANATFFTGFDTGIGLGSVFAGAVASAIGYSGLYLSFSLFIALAALLYFILAKREKKASETLSHVS